MAIGAHELLLIVRAQNQASALLGRVGRDVRRLQNLRDINMQRAATMNKLQRNQIAQTNQIARIQSVMAADGKVRLQHEQAIARNSLQQYNVNSRLTNLDVRRTSLDRARAGLEVQRLNLLRQELGIESSMERIELRRQGLNNQIGRLNTQGLRNRQQLMQLDRQEFGLQTQLLERQLRYNQARRRVTALTGGEGSAVSLRDAQTRANIARRRMRETQMALAEIPGQRGIREAVGTDIQANIRLAQTQLATLGTEERKVAAQASVLAERHKVLAAQLANVDARTVALDSTEGQLIRELAILENELGIINARWAEHVTVTKAAGEQLLVLREEEKLLNQQLAEQNALLARQNLDRLRTGAQAVGHVGRVMQIAGLIGTAAFAAMGISAAHFNTEAVRASTQVGRIGSNASTVVANAGRIEKAILGIMQVVPANQHDLTDALYNIYSSMNTTFGQGTRLLKLFGQVWVAGGMLGSINDVADALITLGNNWHINAGNMREWNKIAASTLATVRFGRLTVEQYTQTMNQLAPAFHGAGQSIEQMNGAIAFLTRLMPSQRMSAAGLARLMEVIGRFAARPAPGFEKLAQDIQDAHGNLLPLDKVMEIFINRFPKLKTSGVFLNNFIKMISGQQGTVQARRALQGLVKNFDLYRKTLQNTTGDTKEFQRSLKAMQQSAGVRWAQFINDLRVIGLELGMVVLPFLLKIADALQVAIKWFEGLSQSTKNTIGRLAAITAVGLLVLGTLAAIAGSITAMIISFRLLRSESASLAAIFGLGGKSATGMASELGAINYKAGILIGTITTLIALWAKFPHQTDAVIRELGGFSKILGAIGIGFSIAGGAKLLRMVSGLDKLGAEALAAMGTVGRLRGELYALTRLSPYIVAIAVTYTVAKGMADKFKKEHHSDFVRGITDVASHIPIAGDFFLAGAKSGEDFGKAFNKMVDFWIDKNLVRSKAKVRQMTQEAINTATSPTGISQTQAILQQHVIAASSAVPQYEKMTAQTDLLKKNWKDIDRIFRTYIDMIPRAVSGTARFTAKGKDSAFVMTDKQFINEIIKLRRLKAASEAVTGGTPAELLKDQAAWIAFHKALDALTARSTALQKKMIDDLLNIAGTVSTISDTRALELAKNADRLRKIAEKSPTLANWKAYYAAQAALQKAAGADQLSMVSDVVSAQDDIATQAATQRAHDVGSIGKKQFFAELKQVLELRRAYLKSHSIADQKKFFDARKKLMKESSDAEKQYLSDAVRRTNDAYKQQIQNQNQAYKTSLNNLSQMYNQFFSEQQQNFGQLFQGSVLTGEGANIIQQFGFTMGPKDYLKDLQGQVSQFRRFNADLAKLGRRGAPKALTDQIRALGAKEGLPHIQEILKMTPTQWNRYVTAFKTGQKLIHDAAMAQLKGELKMYRQHGVNVAKAIIEGIRSQDSGLENALRKMLADLGIKPAKGYKPSPKSGNVIHNNHTTIHVGSGHSDAQTRANLRHGLWRTRVHTSGPFR
jgi:TP901 family phage tail tape measure protein